MRHLRWTIALIFLCALLSSCSGKASVTGQATPQECLAKWHRAMLNGDWDAFRQCYQCKSPAHEEAVLACYQVLSAAMKLGQELESHFGARDWDAFEKSRQGQGMEPLVPPWKFDRKWIDGRPIAVHGDVADVILYPSIQPEMAASMRMVCKGSQWFWDCQDCFRSPDKMSGMFRELTRSINKAIEECNKPGATIESVKSAMWL